MQSCCCRRCSPVWSLVAAYCLLWPETFRSEMVLNLPGAGASASINLSDIGQTSTGAGSAFGDKSMSPKIIYQEIARSARVRGMAAKRLGMPFAEFPSPRIKLVDQTALMTIIMEARTPEQAQRSTRCCCRSCPPSWTCCAATRLTGAPARSRHRLPTWSLRCRLRVASCSSSRPTRRWCLSNIFRQ